jgi:very-short-patch-repair endonuclease
MEAEEPWFLDAGMTTDTTIGIEPKALRLARYLREFVSLRSTTVHNVAKYDSVLWFSDMPQEPECQSPAWNSDFEPGDPWLEVHKQQFPKSPEPPQIILPWIDQQALKRATHKIPELRPTRLVPDPDAEIGDGEDPPLVEDRLGDHPEVTRAYEGYRPIWEAWSREYTRRESIQTIYAELFRLHTQVRKQNEIVELILGLGLLDWRSSKSVPILRHMVSARVDLHFDPATGVIRLECAAEGAQLRIEDDMLDAELRPDRSHYASVGEQLNAIGDDVWDRPRMSIALKSWAGAFHADSQWSSDLRPASGSASKPVVSFAPALILRKRTQAGMMRIYDAIIHRLSSDVPEIPQGWNSLIEDLDDLEGPESSTGYDQRTGPPNLSPQETFFPLPANREQRRIVEAINQRRGVLVQGPPGTGKSHSIANLMCHLLASGKRVLITAETGHALQVLKDKLPGEIQPLCVSLLGQGGDAFAELNASVQGITSRFATWTPGAYDQRIAEIDRELDANRRSLAKIDSELRSLREEETYPHSLTSGAYKGTASGIADRVSSERQRFGWLQVPRHASDDPPVTKADLTTWLRIRRSYDDDAVASSKLQLVASEKLPTPTDFGIAVATERETKEAVEHLVELRRHPAYGPIMALQTRERAQFADVLRKLSETRRRFDRPGYSWLAVALRAAVDGRQALWRALLDHSQNLIGQVDELLRTLGSSSVSIPVEKEAKTVRGDAAAVISHLQAGGKWISWGLLTPRAVRERTYLRAKVTVDGQPADTPERLKLVCCHLDLAVAIQNLEQAWADHGGLPASSQPRIRLAAIKEHVGVLGDALNYVEACQQLNPFMAAARPAIPEPDWLSGQATEWLEIIDATTFEERYRLATQQVTASLRELKSMGDLHDSHPVIGSLIRAIEQRNVTTYSQAHHGVRQVEQVRRDQKLRQHTESRIVATVPGLIDAVANDIDNTAWDERLGELEEAWHWAIADNWLQKRTDFTYQQELWQRRHDAESVIGQLLAESASLRAWTHFFNRISNKPSVRGALNAWRGAVQAMGKGTGRSAKLERLRREARQYMDQCREAIPVWIMPRYLVAQMIDPAPARYDLVIVDEASQLGIESLFLFYIAKKMVVVGDDQQISPYGIGIADEAIAGLQHHYLDGIPYQYALSASSSLYANAKIRFGQNIVLREHFRCMPEIIQFSNDLCYASNGTPLDPLRAYPANRLQPLVLRHVPDGYRTGSPQNALNEPEADALLAQIIACIDDARYSGRTMGVISLQGEAQAKLIEHKLLERLEPEVIEERRLICGDAYAFQGDERHIIFLSMVAAPNERIGSLSSESARQRFNVAASRAQDQLWLFHSATLDVLSPTCMRHRLLAYMLHPERQTTSEASQRFESLLERHVFDQISSKGFHVRTQVSVGDPTNHRYRIDLVVEGMQGRLAVECDGDQWHGPDRYEQDMARQRDLERAGWQFVRIRGGDFYRDRAKAMEPLWAELDRLGIKPGGIDEAAAEPPPPAENQHVADRNVDESINANATPPDTGADFKSGDQGAHLRTKEEDQSNTSSRGEPSSTPQLLSSLFVPYVAYEGRAGDDPRSISLGAVAEGLCRIVDIEGPMLVKRAYDIYLRGCGIKRMGHELKSTMNKALSSAIRQGRIISENESEARGLLFATVRAKDVPSVKVRTRGPRIFSEIPPSELRAVAKYVLEHAGVEAGTDEHLRSVLEHFDLRRLTTQVGTAILEIIDRKNDHVADLFTGEQL